MIWKLSLRPRIVEVHRQLGTGFRPLVGPPITLEICRDSRAAVIHLYPLCFGTFWYPPITRFNFVLDAIYLDYDIYRELPFFFGIVNKSELS